MPPDKDPILDALERSKTFVTYFSNGANPEMNSLIEALHIAIKKRHDEKTYKGFSMRSTQQRPGEYYFCDEFGKPIFRIHTL